MTFELPYSDFSVEIKNWILQRAAQWSYESKTKITETENGTNADPVIVIDIFDQKVAVLFALTWL